MLNEGELLYNTVLLSAKHQHESAIGIPMRPLLNLLPTFLPVPPLETVTEKYGRLHKFGCHPWAAAVLIFSVLFQLFNICATKANT